MYRRRARISRRPRRVAGNTTVARGTTVRDEEAFVSSSRILQPVKTHPPGGSFGYQLNAGSTITAAANDAAARSGALTNNVQIILLNGMSQGSGSHQRNPSSTMSQMRTLYLKAGITGPADFLSTTATTEVDFHTACVPQFLQMLVVYDKRPTNPPTYPTMADFYEQATDPMSHMPVNTRTRWDILYRKTWSWKFQPWNLQAGGIYTGARVSMINDGSNTPLIDIRIPINRVAQFIANPTPSADAQSVTEIVTGHLYLVFVSNRAYVSQRAVRLYAYPRLSFVDL